jgi:5-methylcytosine-specific restriction protein A
MGRLQTLKPRLLQTSSSRLAILEAKAGSTAMPHGRAWMETRRRVALAYGYRCAACTQVWRPERDQIDHRIPREQGGSNDDSNLQPLCKPCHDAKSAAEARLRAGLPA